MLRDLPVNNGNLCGCWEQVEQNFNVPRKVDNYLALYQQILDIERQSFEA